MEDFARRLNSDWPERMQEILSFGQERRLMPISMCKYEYVASSFFNFIYSFIISLLPTEDAFSLINLSYLVTPFLFDINLLFV